MNFKDDGRTEVFWRSADESHRVQVNSPDRARRILRESIAAGRLEYTVSFAVFLTAFYQRPVQDASNKILGGRRLERIHTMGYIVHSDYTAQPGYALSILCIPISRQRQGRARDVTRRTENGTFGAKLLWGRSISCSR